jgi:hypothetical protein
MFTRGELHNMLAPALLEPCGDPAAAAPRAALMRVCGQSLGRQGAAGSAGGQCVRAWLPQWRGASCGRRLPALLSCAMRNGGTAPVPQYLYRELGARGDTQIRPHFQPGGQRAG